MPGPLNDATTTGLGAALTIHQRRHEVLISNLANVETPGYRAHDLQDFKGALEQAFAAASAGTDPRTEAQTIEDPTMPARADGNTVDLDLQMAKLSANAGRYNALARILGKRFALLRQAIEGAR